MDQATAAGNVSRETQVHCVVPELDAQGSADDQWRCPGIVCMRVASLQEDCPSLLAEPRKTGIGPLSHSSTGWRIHIEREISFGADSPPLYEVAADFSLPGHSLVAAGKSISALLSQTFLGWAGDFKV